jgi:MFS superfamily sulfate permease-like transporter
MQTFNCKTERTEGRLKMMFSGYLTLQNAKEIKNYLVTLDNEFQSIDIHVKEASGIDVSFLQMIESFRITHANEGRKVKITMDLPYDLKTLLSNAGVVYPVK